MAGKAESQPSPSELEEGFPLSRYAALLEEERDEYLNDLKRVAADENYRKRVARDQEGLVARAWLAVKELLPVLDDLERALGSRTARGGQAGGGRSARPPRAARGARPRGTSSRWRRRDSSIRTSTRRSSRSPPSRRSAPSSRSCRRATASATASCARPESWCRRANEGPVRSPRGEEGLGQNRTPTGSSRASTIRIRTRATRPPRSWQGDPGRLRRPFGLEKRKQYDRVGPRMFSGAGGGPGAGGNFNWSGNFSDLGDIGDLFGSIFGNAGAARAPRSVASMASAGATSRWRSTSRRTRSKA